MSFLNIFLFNVYPYIAAAIFFIGSWIRYDYAQYTWRAGSSQMLSPRKDKRYMMIASNLFHLGILGVLAGHAFGMLTPHWMYEAWLPIAVKQQMAMFGGGAAGLMTIIGAGMLLYRRLTNDRVRATSSTADILIIALLFTQACLGVISIAFSAQHLDGSEMMKLVGWAQGIVYFGHDPVAHLEGVAVIFRIHILLGMTLFAVFPFCRLVHIWSVPVEYLTRRYQIVRNRR